MRTLLSLLATFSVSVPLAAQELDADEKQRVAAAQKAVRAALNDAVKRLETGDYSGFVTKSLTAGAAQALGPSKAWVAKRFQRDATTRQLFLEELRRMQQAKIVFAPDIKSAQFERIVPPDKSKPTGPIPTPAQVAAVKLKLVGYSGDLPQVMKAAMADLEAKKYERFVSRMLPVYELKFQQAAGTAGNLVKKMQSVPAIPTAMIAEFKHLQKLKPKLSAKKTIATYSLKTQINKKRSIIRDVKFQRTEFGWRFIDNSTKQRRALMAAQTGSGLEPLLPLAFYKSGREWRLSEDLSRRFDRRDFKGDSYEPPDVKPLPDRPLK